MSGLNFPFEKGKAVKKLATRVGWVERSDTHRLGLRSTMGIGAQRLNPS
jgi:hypothetical protein